MLISSILSVSRLRRIVPKSHQGVNFEEMHCIKKVLFIVAFIACINKKFDEEFTFSTFLQDFADSFQKIVKMQKLLSNINHIEKFIQLFISNQIVNQVFICESISRYFK